MQCGQSGTGREVGCISACGSHTQANSTGGTQTTQASRLTAAVVRLQSGPHHYCSAAHHTRSVTSREQERLEYKWRRSSGCWLVADSRLLRLLSPLVPRDATSGESGDRRRACARVIILICRARDMEDAGAPVTVLFGWSRAMQHWPIDQCDTAAVDQAHTAT